VVVQVDLAAAAVVVQVDISTPIIKVLPLEQLTQFKLVLEEQALIQILQVQALMAGPETDQIQVSITQ
jgi:hypothetical protein